MKKATPSSSRLTVKKSTIPNAGNGLFAKVNFEKGDIITEYKGRRCKWKDVEDDVNNAYIYHISDDAVIDASNNIHSFGRYANDASGMRRIKGITNNAEYVEDEDRVFIQAKKNIPAGSEIFVSYGPLYWKQMKENMAIEKAAQQASQKKKKTASKNECPQ